MNILCFLLFRTVTLDIHDLPYELMSSSKCPLMVSTYNNYLTIAKKWSLTLFFFFVSILFVYLFICKANLIILMKPLINDYSFISLIKIDCMQKNFIYLSLITLLRKRDFLILPEDVELRSDLIRRILGFLPDLGMDVEAWSGIWEMKHLFVANLWLPSSNAVTLLHMIWKRIRVPWWPTRGWSFIVPRAEYSWNMHVWIVVILLVSFKI